MSIPEIREGMKKLGFKSPHFASSDSVTALDDWIEKEARFAAGAMLRAVSATQIWSRSVRALGSASCRGRDRCWRRRSSPLTIPTPTIFFTGSANSAIIIDALRVAEAERARDASRIERLREFVEFSRALRELDGREFVRQGHFREKVQPSFLQYVRPDDEIAAVFGDAVLGEARVNPDGTLDFTRWARPQNDGPALEVLALTRWRDAQPGPGRDAPSRHAGARGRRSGLHPVARERALVRHLGGGERVSLLYAARAGRGARSRRRMARGELATRPGPAPAVPSRTNSRRASTPIGAQRTAITAQGLASPAASRKRLSTLR